MAKGLYKAVENVCAFEKGKMCSALKTKDCTDCAFF